MASPTPSFLCKSAPGTHRSTRGFALLITITLLAFLVLLLVSLASLTRVETQVAGNNLHLAQARQNALMALNLALGEVQRSTGPDRRVTAPANLTAPAAAHPRWIGVYGNTAAADYAQAPSAVTPSASRLVQWLVSGNEGLAITADGSGTVTSATPSFISAPGDAITVGGGGALSTATATSDITLGAGNIPARLLVGPGSVDAINATADYVVAPLKEIRASGGSVPGLAAADTPVIGAYAWWAGDESTKAKVNLRNSYLSQSVAADQTGFQRHGFVTAQRSAVELMNYDSVNALTGIYSGTDPVITNLLSVNQLPFVSTVAADQTKLTSACKSRFHDLTARGYGVPADAYAGGLKKDLSADIADTAAGASGNRPGDAAPLFPREKATDRVPTWGLLRSFPRNTPASGSLAPTPPVVDSNGDYTSSGVSPVINFAGLGLDFYLDADGNIQAAMFPVLILWNPYAATLPATNYETGFRVHTFNGSSDHSRYFVEKRAGTSGAYATVATLDLHAGALVAGGSGVANAGFIRFALRGEEMKPGEAQVYVLGSTAAYSAGSSTLVRYAPGSNGITNYASWTTVGMSVDSTPEYENGQMQVRTVNPEGRHALNVVLAKPGRLTGWNGTDIGTDWYQVVLDSNLRTRGGNNAFWKYPYPQIDFDSPSMPTASTGATTTMFSSTVMEGRGGFNSQAHFIGALGTGGGQGGRFRWLITGNPRAPIVRNTRTENSDFTRGNTLFGSLGLFTKLGGGTNRDPLFPYNGYTSGYNTAIGASQEGGGRAVLFDVLGSPDRLLSVGQLQHAPFGIYGFNSSYALGNAWADVRIPRDRHYLADWFSPDFENTTDATLYDLSWHLNRALWDRYFVSGVPSSWTAADVAAARVLPNARMTYFRRNGVLPSVDDIRYAGASSAAYDKAAANLLVDGAFNVNSTSEHAWRALLGSTLGIPANTDYADAGDSVSTIAPVPRFSANQSQTGHTNTMTLEGGNYLGNRGLVLSTSNNGLAPATLQALVNELARTIVAEVRTRGPFLSVADFVNRRLVSATDPNAATAATGIRGTLQAAIDSMGTTAASTANVNTRNWTNTGAALGAGDKPKAGWDTEHYLGAPLGSSTSQNATRFASCPKFMTQADLLSLLGPALTVRGDTFVIRTYGEVRNPVTGAIEGRAWCEAHVQRLPDYVDDSLPAETALASAPASAAKTTNQTFGRRYEIVSLRWLSPSDI